MKDPVILVVDGAGEVRSRLARLLAGGCGALLEVCDPERVLQTVRERLADLVILGAADSPAGDRLTLARAIRRLSPLLPLILLVKTSSEELAIAALRAGVTDYLARACADEELTASVRRCLAERPAGAAPGRPAAAGAAGGGIVGESQPMRALRAYILRVAATDSTVLVTGETGTGKELVAELIHRQSPRHARPFVCVNSAALPDNLFESELFGHERGAFTGAVAASPGKFELANQGSLLLDEVGDLSPYSQVKLLRVLERKEVYRLGGKATIRLDVRIIAATNQDLQQLVGERRFRSDLYFRLNVARIHVPPLRERKEDIPLLFAHFVREFNARFGRDVEGPTAEASRALLAHDWPGNVRELKNLLESVFINLSSSTIGLGDLPEPLRRRAQDSGPPPDERERLLAALLATKWNRSQAAERLHWSRMTLYRKMAKYQIARRGGAGTPV
jgi:DNA-binding NtrC family response regulator